MSERFRIARLGAQGDGEAVGADGIVHVPFSLPGEWVRANRHGRRARLVEVIEPSPMRIEPRCRHFGTCGGCALQHLAQADYEAWKAQRVTHALETQGIDVPLRPMVRCRPASRRRAVFSAVAVGGEVVVGYHEAGSHRIVPIVECPVLRPEIVALVPVLRELAETAGVTRNESRISVTYTDSGPDVALTDLPPLTDRRRRALAGFALARGISRLSAGDEIVIEPKKPVVMAGSVALTPPAGGFLQATAEAEEAMAALVIHHLGRCRRIADLYAGSGAFALRLAAFAGVHAVESAADALAALERASRMAPGLRTVTTERRDLARRPLTIGELAAFDGVVFDPPRAGAPAQAAQIARSEVACVAAVSCNPATLARDLATLLAGGYVIRSVTPIDQFLWSPHVEAVALLEKSPGRGRNARHAARIFRT